MSEIDWSKAPRCYQVWIESFTPTKNGQGWHADAGDRWVDVNGQYWLKSGEESGSCKAHYRPSPAWSGEGKPPVGTVCEISFDGGPLGKALITYRAGNLLCWKWEAQKGEDECCSYVHRLAFKPIRTPEQIAADEREAAIRAIIYDLQDAENLSSLPSIANCLYGKGYRKP